MKSVGWMSLEVLHFCKCVSYVLRDLGSCFDRNGNGKAAVGVNERKNVAVAACGHWDYWAHCVNVHDFSWVEGILCCPIGLFVMVLAQCALRACLLVRGFGL